MSTDQQEHPNSRRTAILMALACFTVVWLFWRDSGIPLAAWIGGLIAFLAGAVFLSNVTGTGQLTPRALIIFAIGMAVALILIFTGIAATT